MKWSGGWEPPKPLGEPATWLEHRQVWDIRRQIREQRAEFRRPVRFANQSLDQHVAAQLAKKAQNKAAAPNVADLIDGTPDAVRWLRGQMTARNKPEEGGRSAGKPQSKPPFRIACMEAADREVTVLFKWAREYGITDPRFPVKWGKRGKVIGVTGGDLRAVDWCARELIAALAERGVVDGMADDVWRTRLNHYQVWPDLAAFFESEDEIDQTPIEVEEEGLF